MGPPVYPIVWPKAVAALDALPGSHREHNLTLRQEAIVLGTHQPIGRCVQRLINYLASVFVV